MTNNRKHKTQSLLTTYKITSKVRIWGRESNPFSSLLLCFSMIDFNDNHSKWLFDPTRSLELVECRLMPLAHINRTRANVRFGPISDKAPSSLTQSVLSVILTSQKHRCSLAKSASIYSGLPFFRKSARYPQVSATERSGGFGKRNFRNRAVKLIFDEAHL